MNEPRPNLVTGNLLAEAFAAQPDPGNPHVVDDQGLLVRWSSGLLGDDEQQAWTTHLALCPACRDVLETLIAADLVAPPPTLSEQSQAVSEVSPTVRRGRGVLSHLVTWSAVALLLAVGSTFLFTSRPPPREFALHARLDRDWGYSLGGRQFSKSLQTEARIPNASQQQRLSELTTRVQQQVNDLEAQIELGLLLLELRRLETAREHLQIAERIAPDHPQAQEGLGLIDFDGGRFLEAEAHFRKALTAAPANEDFQINLAICQEKLGKRSDALANWHELRQKTRDSGLRTAIDSWLNR